MQNVICSALLGIALTACARDQQMADRPTGPAVPHLGAGESQADRDFIDRYRLASKGVRWGQMFYPRQAAKMHQEGKAIVRVDFDRAGRIINLGLIQSTGHPLFDEASIQAFSDPGKLSPVPAELAPGINVFSMDFSMAWSLGSSEYAH